jgi:hypothetical protein
MHDRKHSFLRPLLRLSVVCHCVGREQIPVGGSGLGHDRECGVLGAIVTRSVTGDNCPHLEIARPALGVCYISAWRE